MNIAATRGPLGLKEDRPQKNPDRLAKVAALPCVICWEWGMKQYSPTEVHHCKSGRFSSQKSPDEMTIPLCHGHHNKLRPHPGDEEKIGFHNSQETWEANYGQDHEWLSWVEERINL